MNKQQRINRIVAILRDKNGESIKELANQLGVTEMTIRRDIKHLQESRIVRVVSGAVIYNGEPMDESDGDRYNLSVQKSRRVSEKYRIGKMAASLVQPKDVIYIDIGTTTPNIIQHLPENMPVVIVCCTMNALMETQKKGIEEIIFTGGQFRSDVQMFESREGVELLSRTRISKAFISAAGVNDKLGVTCINSCEVETKSAAMQCALDKILVVDSSKFDAVKPAFFAKLDEFNAVVTD
ncbi:MAG: DeoR/GlpR family DNA-binding transcription regulator, partial [Dethiobacteria bacterium]